MTIRARDYGLIAILLLAASAHAFDFGNLGETLKRVQQIQQSPELARAQEIVKEIRGPDEREEIAIGRQIAGNLLGAAPLVKDPRLQSYVNQVGRWVANQSERPDLPWHFGVIESEDINAFAAPGGYIFLTKGLYRLLDNEADLAGVLGHEIGHVIRQHHLKILQQQKLIAGGSEFLAREAGGGNSAIQKIIGSGAEIVARGLDKDAEFEADRIGVVLATRAGYDAFGLPGVLQQIGHRAAGDSSVALLFKTHPHPDVRLEKLSAAMGDRFDRMHGLTLPEYFYRLGD